MKASRYLFNFISTFSKKNVSGSEIARYRNTRYWAVIDTEDTLVCLCVYRKGALEVVRRLEARTTA